MVTTYEKRQRYPQRYARKDARTRIYQVMFDDKNSAKINDPCKRELWPTYNQAHAVDVYLTYRQQAHFSPERDAELRAILKIKD